MLVFTNNNRAYEVFAIFKHSSHRKKCHVDRADQRRRSARLIIRELNTSETSNSLLNAVKSEGKSPHSSKSSCSFSDLTGSVWRPLELHKEPESCQEASSSCVDKSPGRKERLRKRRGCSLEETVSQQPQTRKRKKFSDSQLPSEASYFPSQAVESPTDCPEHWTRSKDKEHPGPEPVDSHSPCSFQTGPPHSQELKKHKEETVESLRVAADHRCKHKGKGQHRTSSEEHSPLRKPSTHKRKKSFSIKGKGRKGKDRLELSQEQGGKQK